MKTYLNINSIQDKSIPGSKLEESYVSQENGKGLSTNDFTDVLKNKLLSLNNYDDSELNEKLLKLEQNLNSILGEGSTEAIENFNEIISFLSGIEDSESLDNIIAAIELQISDKQDKINDLQKIREGASKGETALQEIPEEYITEDELENKGYLTEHQDITPEILQNENEVAIKVGNNTSNYTTINYSKFSNDLTGRIEATPEEFTFRPSAGDKSIRDESALIKRIKGNTIVWNQLANVSNPVRIDFLENTDVYYQILGRLNKGIRIIKGHKYIGTGYVETNIETRISFGISSSMQEGQIITSFGTGYYERIFDASTDKDSDILYVNNYSGQKGFLQGDYISCTLNLFDLTKMFGAGNEPTTVEEFKALFPNNYYDYNAGELVSMTSNGLFANGFNQLEDEWEIGGIDGNGVLNNNTTCIRSKNFIPVIRGAHYYLKDANYQSADRARVYLFDEKFQFVDYWTIRNGVREFYKQASYFKVSTLTAYGSTTYKNDLCINLSHTGIRNGEYEPYWDATKDLSIIQKYFPNGMRSAGSIYDEISFDEATQKWVAIQRVGSVDLGSLGWYVQSGYEEKGGFAVQVPRRATTQNIVTSIPYSRNFYWSNFDKSADNVIYTSTNTKVLFAKYTNYTDVTSFKSAMSGVMLYYELAEPIITTIEEPIDLSYKVGDFGIEKMLSDSFSAPFKADIIYQFNATDRVRENSMNISKLSKKHTLLESEVNNHEGQINEFNTRLSEAETLTRKVEDGSVVVDNTLSEVVADSNKPVSSAAVNTEFNDRNGKYRITDLELRDNGVYLGTIWEYNTKGVIAQSTVLNTFYSMGPLTYLCFNRKEKTVAVKGQEAATVDDDILFVRNGQSSYQPTALLSGIDLLNKTHKLNIECVHGGCWAKDGNIYAEADSTEKVRMRSLGYYAINGISDKIVDVTTPTGVAYSIIQYDSEFNFVKFNSRYDQNLNATCRYVRFVLAKEDGSEFTSSYVNIIVNVSSKNSPKFYPTKREGDIIFMHYAVGRPIIPEFSSEAEGTATTDYKGDNALLLNKGYIALPPDYTPTGKPCPVIIYCHGTSGVVYNNNYLPTNAKYINFLAKCGYAVIGCSTFTDEFKSNADDGNFPDMRSRACYEGLWNIMTEEFNLDKSGVYIYGFSAGGMNTLMLSYNNNIPVKACALLAGSIDIVCNMRILADYCCEYFFSQIGLTGRDLPTGLASDGVRMHPMSPTVTQDIIDNWQYFVGLNPFCFNSTLDYEAFLEKYALVNNSTTVLSNDDELNAIVSEAKVFFPKPIKMWHAVDDVNVPIQISRWWRDMVQRGGGCCYLREFPSGCGAHYAVGSSIRESEFTIPMTSYTTKYGEVIDSIPVAYAELVDWFNQW